MYVSRWGPKHTAMESPGNTPQKMSQGVFGHMHTYVEVLHIQKGNRQQRQNRWAKASSRVNKGQIYIPAPRVPRWVDFQVFCANRV